MSQYTMAYGKNASSRDPLNHWSQGMVYHFTLLCNAGALKQCKKQAIYRDEFGTSP